MVVLCFGQLSFDLIGFKESKAPLFRLTWFSLLFGPLLLLPFFSCWKTLAGHEKILIVALAALFIIITQKPPNAFVLSGLFTIAVAIYFFHKRVIYRPHLFFILLFAYGLINAVSLLWSTDTSQGLEHLKFLSPLLYIPILFCFFRLDRRQFDLVALIVFRAAVFYAVYSICSWAIESRFLDYPLADSFSLGKYRIDGESPYDVVYAWTNHTHPTYNAANLMFALGIGWYYIGKKNAMDNIKRAELCFFVVITLLLTILTASRFMLVAWGLVNFFGILFLIQENRKLFLTIFSLSLATVLSGLIVFSDTVRNFMNDPARIALFKGTFEAIGDHTWSGVGMGSMSEYVNTYETSRTTHLHPHNQLIGDWLQTGFLGFSIMLCIIVLILYKSFVQRNWLLWASLLSYMLLMCIEMPLIYPNGIFLFGLAFSFLMQRDPSVRPLFDFKRKKKTRQLQFQVVTDKRA